MITYMLLLNILLCLLGGFNAQEQANTLLKFPTELQPQLYSTKPTLSFDPAGNLWMWAKWGGDEYVSRIKPNGTLELDKVLVHQPSDDYPRYIPGISLVSDRWGNVYFGLSTRRPIEGSSNYEESSIHLFQVTPQGEVRDFFPWPMLEGWGSYLEILPSDTLLILGRDYRNYQNSRWSGRIVKALLDSTGITPIDDRTYAGEGYPQRMVNIPREFRNIYFDWNRGYGFVAELRTRSEAENIELLLLRFDLKRSGNTIPQDSVGRFIWRDYIWRTYEDTWIGRMTFEQYKGSGYILYFSDPEDNSITQVLRLDNLGVPIDPSTLANGGIKEPLNFNRLPETAKQYADYDIWNKLTYKDIIRDSAQVLFWGCDDKGNLYSYRKIKTYGEEQ